MSNITRSLGIVQDVDPQASLLPPPGTRLAVFRRTRQGEQAIGVLEPGEAFQPRLFERRSALRLLAISDDPNLRHEFSRPYLHRDQVHGFVLHFRIEFRVSEPARLVETLPRDPLARIEKEIVDVVGRSVQGMEWSDIESQRDEIGRRALHLSPASADGHRQENLERLRLFCDDHGIELLDIDIRCRLNEPEVQVDIAKVKEDREQQTLQLSQATEKVRQRGELEIQLERREMEGLIAAVDRSRLMADQMLAHLDHALGKVADGVDSAPALRQAIVEVAKLQRELYQVTATSRPEVSRLEGSGFRVLGPAAEGGALAHQGVLLSELLDHVAALDCPVDEQRRCLGKALLVVGETLQGDQADAQELERRTTELQATLHGLVRALRSSEQRRFFRDLCDREGWEHSA